MTNYLPASEPYLLTFHQIGSVGAGQLVSTQQAQNLPFAVKRVFWVFDTPPETRRGQHANKITEEVMIAVQGAVTVETESRSGQTQTFTLRDPQQGLYIPPYCWLNIQFAPGTVLLCLTSTDFDEADYILDRQEFYRYQQK